MVSGVPHKDMQLSSILSLTTTFGYTQYPH